MTRHYIINGKRMTAREVAEIRNPTDEQKAQFISQSGLSDERLRDLEMIGDAIVPIVTELMATQFRPYFERLKALEERAVEIEKGGIRYGGIFQRAVGYSRGTFVTHEGSAFCAIRNTEPGEVPGKSDAFQLAVKRGGDR